MRDEIFEISIRIAIGVVLFGFFLIMYATLMKELKSAGETTTETSGVLSIAYQEDIRGTFVLGMGTVSGEEYYTCYERLEDGGITLLKLDAETTIIYQTLDEGEEAYVEKQVTKSGRVTSAKLYVPTDTVQREYNLDLDT